MLNLIIGIILGVVLTLAYTDPSKLSDGLHSLEEAARQGGEIIEENYEHGGGLYGGGL